ncbi:MAG: hypothetical protein ACI9R3_001966 [Verrucomicrobiales bacterium]|jgi:hypothetical protein
MQGERFIPPASGSEDGASPMIDRFRDGQSRRLGMLKFGGWFHVQLILRGRLLSLSTSAHSLLAITSNGRGML